MEVFKDGFKAANRISKLAMGKCGERDLPPKNRLCWERRCAARGRSGARRWARRAGAAGGELRTRAPPLAVAQNDFVFVCVCVRETMLRGAGRSRADPIRAAAAVGSRCWRVGPGSRSAAIRSRNAGVAGRGRRRSGCSLGRTPPGFLSETAPIFSGLPCRSPDSRDAALGKAQI